MDKAIRLSMIGVGASSRKA